MFTCVERFETLVVLLLSSLSMLLCEHCSSGDRQHICRYHVALCYVILARSTIMYNAMPCHHATHFPDPITPFTMPCYYFVNSGISVLHSLIYETSHTPPVYRGLAVWRCLFSVFLGAELQPGSGGTNHERLAVMAVPLHKTACLLLFSGHSGCLVDALSFTTSAQTCRGISRSQGNSGTYVDLRTK